jgi:hypothetical protein
MGCFVSGRLISHEPAMNSFFVKACLRSEVPMWENRFRAQNKVLTRVFAIVINRDSITKVILLLHF